jgi:hypothetical protein
VNDYDNVNDVDDGDDDDDDGGKILVRYMIFSNNLTLIFAMSQQI